jgi:hypothetical protein
MRAHGDLLDLLDEAVVPVEIDAGAGMGVRGALGSGTTSGCRARGPALRGVTFLAPPAVAAALF